MNASGRNGLCARSKDLKQLNTPAGLGPARGVFFYVFPVGSGVQQGAHAAGAHVLYSGSSIKRSVQRSAARVAWK